MRSVYNVCGGAYMVDKEPYTDYLGSLTRQAPSPLIIFSAAGPSEAEGGGIGGASVWFEV